MQPDDNVGMDSDDCECCGGPTYGCTDDLGDPVCEECQKDSEEE